MRELTPYTTLLLLMLLAPWHTSAQPPMSNKANTFKWEPAFLVIHGGDYYSCGEFTFAHDGNLKNNCIVFSWLPCEAFFRFNHSKYALVEECMDSTSADIPIHSIADSLSNEFHLCEPFLPIDICIRDENDKQVKEVMKAIRKCKRRQRPIFLGQKDAIKIIFFNFNQAEAEKILNSVTVIEHPQILVTSDP